MDIDLSQYRKIFALLVTGLVIFAFHYFGLSPRDLTPYGLGVSSIVEPIVEFLIVYGIPAVFVIAQPNGFGDSIFRWWRWVAVGIAVVVALIVLVMLAGALAR